MRIAHVILTSRFAGSERHVLELAAAQAADHEVTLVLRRAAAQARPDAIAQRVDPRVGLELVGDWFAPWHARRLLRRLRPEVAHAHLSGGCRALHSLETGALRLATLHIAYKPRQHAPLDGLVAIAPWQMQAIPEALRARSVQIDNWTVPALPAPDARERLRSGLGIGAHEFVFGALGRAERSKGLDVLIAAFERAALPASRLVIVGQGREWQALRRQAGPQVHMVGFSDRPQDWLAAFDGFVSAARSEPFGLVLLEAMAAGLPVLATASQGARHLAGLIERPLVPLDDVGAMADALRGMHALRPPRRSYDLRRFDLQARRAELEAFYRQGLARGRGQHG